LVAGDRVLLKCGDTWTEELAPQRNGTARNPIIIGYYGEGAKPVIDRQDQNQDRVGIRLADQKGFKIVGLEFDSCMTGIYAEYSDDCPTKKFIWIEDCNMTIESCLFEGCRSPLPRRRRSTSSRSVKIRPRR
jgi:hypothetical protein